MQVAVLGTGMVGKCIATKLTQLGHKVTMGSRSAANEKAAAWASAAGAGASHGTFKDAAAGGELIFLCTKGDFAIDALKSAGAGNLKGKTVVDITNPLDFSKGMPPTLFLSNTTSMAEEIQKAFPEAHIVKSLNIVNCEVMVDPKKTGGDPTMFLCGNDAGAKDAVRKVLMDFGWKDITDLGDITAARGMEMVLPLWLRTYMATGTGYFGFKIMRPQSTVVTR